MIKKDFPRTKVIDRKVHQLIYGGTYAKRQNALDEAKLQRRHSRNVRVVKHSTKKLWAVYIH